MSRFIHSKPVWQFLRRSFAGIVLIYVFYNLAPGFQAVGYVPFREDPLGNLSRMALPTVSLALPILAALSRILRVMFVDAHAHAFYRLTVHNDQTHAEVLALVDELLAIRPDRDRGLTGSGLGESLIRVPAPNRR